METKRSRRGCTACRIRHVKCDETLPVCMRCREANRDCEQTPLISQWRKTKEARRASASPGKGGFADQTWVQIPPTLTFVVDGVFEDTYMQSQPTEVSPVRAGSTPSPRSSSLENNADTSQFAANLASSSEVLHWPMMTSPFPDLSSLDCLASLDDGTSFVPGGISEPEASNTGNITGSGSEIASYASDIARHTSAATSYTSEIRAVQSSSQPSTTDSRLIKDPMEARLLRHYCRTLAPWFDVTDTNRHFQLEVSKRAPNCEVLLNAIFALSALHLSRVSSFDASKAEVYHSRCNSLLIPLLNIDNSVADENLLATVVILRKYEEMNVAISGQDLGRHMAGVSALFSSPTCALSSGLGQAAFWQFVRQDVYMSLTRRIPPRTANSIRPPLLNESGAPDHVWANHIVWITLCILAYCFAEQPQDPQAWQDLNQRVAIWDKTKPSTFSPIYFHTASPSKDGSCFPEIWLSDPWHATGMQYYHLAKLLLALYDPNIARPRAGLDYPQEHQQMQRSVLHHARTVCGIAASNDFETTRFTLCAIMMACGGWFTDPHETDAIITLLSVTEKENGWPTKSVIEVLKDCWSKV